MTVYYFYKIWSLDNEYIYIGSTKNFNKRIVEHKSNCNCEKSKKYNYKLYSTIRNNAGVDNFIFDIIDSIETDDKQIVLKHEQELMIKYNSNLNTYKAYLTEAEREQIIIKRNDKFDCLCGGKYMLKHKSQHIKTKKHQIYEQKKQNNTINNITYNITNLTINK